MLISVFDDFLDFGILPGQFSVAQHAFVDRWDAGCSAIIGAAMTVEAVKAQFDMAIVRKHYGLARLAAHRQ